MRSEVTSHWSRPGVRVKRSKVTSHMSNVLYCQRSKVSHLIWVHKVKGQKSKVMGMGPKVISLNGRRPHFFLEMEDDLIFFIKWKTTLIFFKLNTQCLLHYENITRFK